MPDILKQYKLDSATYTGTYGTFASSTYVLLSVVEIFNMHIFCKDYVHGFKVVCHSLISTS